MQVFTGLYQRYPAEIFYLLALWSIVWKGIALWKACKNGSKFWFIIILILNTLGVLEILYIFLLYKIDFSKIQERLKMKK
jgi:hypothetical protein